MNRNIWPGKWQQLKGKIRERWGNLTSDDIEVIAGRREVLAGKIREAYGLGKEEVEKQIAELERSCDSECMQSKTEHFEATQR